MKRDYDKEPLVIKNHNVKIDFVGFVFISLLLVFIFIVAKAEFIMLIICFVVMIFFAKPVKDYAKYKNSYFKFSNDKIEFVNDNEILGSFELNFITQITKIPQMSIAQRQNKSKILSYLSNISSIFIFFVLIWLFWGLNLQDFFKLFLILFVIVLFHYFIFAILQSIYQIFNSKFRFFKFANSLEIKTKDEKAFFIVFINRDEYSDIKEYFLQRLILDINECKIRYF